MPASRSYGDPCGIARGLDLVGERWALLLVRELLLGPKRFTDLRTGLPGASPNVLSQRLKELEEAGVLRRRRLEPPARVWVYELTEWGRELDGVVLRLGRWGARAALPAGGDLSVDALVIALRTTFDPELAGSLRACYEVRLGEDRFRLDVADSRLDVARGRADRPDATIDTDARTLRSVIFGGRPLAEAVGAGDLTMDGDRRAVARLVELFPRPVPAQPARL